MLEPRVGRRRKHVVCCTQLLEPPQPLKKRGIDERNTNWFELHLLIHCVHDRLALLQPARRRLGPIRRHLRHALAGRRRNDGGDRCIVCRRTARLGAESLRDNGSILVPRNVGNRPFLRFLTAFRVQGLGFMLFEMTAALSFPDILYCRVFSSCVCTEALSSFGCRSRDWNAQCNLRGEVSAPRPRF
jgi:hypothetical protein